MSKKLETLQIGGNGEAESTRGMNRREMVRRLATAVTAGTAAAALPGVLSAHPVVRHMANEATLNQADAKAADPAWAPAFFDPHQNETVIVLAERIVPGSTEAQVNRFVDLLLSVDSQETQKAFVNSLSAFEAYSLEHYQKPFKDLTDDQQNHVLTVASTAKPGRSFPEFGRRPGVLGPREQGPGGNHPLTLGDHFENLKHWVSGAYFSSEPGMKFLGWTGQVMWASYPGCQHPAGHV